MESQHQTRAVPELNAYINERFGPSTVAEVELHRLQQLMAIRQMEGVIYDQITHPALQELGFDVHAQDMQQGDSAPRANITGISWLHHTSDDLLRSIQMTPVAEGADAHFERVLSAVYMCSRDGKYDRCY